MGTLFNANPAEPRQKAPKEKKKTPFQIAMEGNAKLVQEVASLRRDLGAHTRRLTDLESRADTQEEWNTEAELAVKKIEKTSAQSALMNQGVECKNCHRSFAYNLGNFPNIGRKKAMEQGLDHYCAECLGVEQ
jgi:hypothetical protein